MKKYDYSDAETRAKSVRRMKETLCKKRLAKDMTKESRKRKKALPSIPVDMIPLLVRDESEFVRYPASPEDIRSVLEALPRGVTDGLRLIELCLGDKDQIRPEEEWAAAPEPDPYVGREGYEMLPGVFHGRVLGTYYPGQAKLRINAFVCGKDSLSPVPVGFYLRMYMLMTLVHEVAHHYDFSSRIARGRWLADDRNKIEIYAEQVQHDWFNRYVVPCLRKDYPDQWNAFQDWIRENVGLDLPVGILLGDPRTTAKGNRIILRTMFDTGRAFQEFVTAFEQGRDLQGARLEFARDLHYAEHYEPALQIIELLLNANRNNIDALVLQADIFNHMRRHKEAWNISRQILQKEPRWAEALEIQVHAFMGLGRYREAIQAVDTLLEIIDKRPCELALWQEEKAEALIELGQYTQAEALLAFLEELTNGRPLWKRRIEQMRKKCRRHRRQNQEGQ